MAIQKEGQIKAGKKDEQNMPGPAESNEPYPVQEGLGILSVFPIVKVDTLQLSKAIKNIRSDLNDRYIYFRAIIVITVIRNSNHETNVYLMGCVCVCVYVDGWCVCCLI